MSRRRGAPLRPCAKGESVHSVNLVGRKIPSSGAGRRASDAGGHWLLAFDRRAARPCLVTAFALPAAAGGQVALSNAGRHRFSHGRGPRQLPARCRPRSRGIRVDSGSPLLVDDRVRLGDAGESFGRDTHSARSDPQHPRPKRRNRSAARHLDPHAVPGDCQRIGCEDSRRLGVRARERDVHGDRRRRRPGGRCRSREATSSTPKA